MQERRIHWTIIKRKHSGRSFPKIWPKDTYVLRLPPGQLPSSSSIRRMGNYVPAKIIDALTNKLSRISILYCSSQNWSTNFKGAKIFTKLDLRWGYNKRSYQRRRSIKAAFVADGKLWETNGHVLRTPEFPATFQAMMNALFDDLIKEGYVIIYMDDILIFSKTIEEHCILVKKVFTTPRGRRSIFETRKMLLRKPSIEYLGMIITHDKVQMDPAKLSAVIDWPTPKCVKDVQSFLRIRQFLSKIPFRALPTLRQPLTALTRKNTTWTWEEAQQTAFDTLKHRFTSAPILLMPDFDKPFRLEDWRFGLRLWRHLIPAIRRRTLASYCLHVQTDASRGTELRPFTKGTSRHHYGPTNLGVTTLKEVHIQLKIWSDHKNLEYFRTAQSLNRRQARWSLFLSRFRFTISHHAGALNRADHLTRRSGPWGGGGILIIRIPRSSIPPFFAVNATGRRSPTPQKDHPRRHQRLRPTRPTGK